MTAPALRDLPVEQSGRPARERLDPRVIAYLDGAAGEGRTLQGNLDSWKRWRLRPRVLRDLTDVRADTRILGIDLAAPVFVAPWAGHGMVDPAGDAATAHGTVDAGIGLAVSSGADRPLAEVGAVSGPYLQQIYLPADKELIRPFVAAAVAAGAAAFLLTVDAPAVGNQVGFRAGLAGLPRRPSVNFPGVDHTRLGTSPSLSPSDIGWLTEVSGLPVLAKGIVRGDDAEIALAAGAAGVVVSNHSGRQLDGSIPTAEALPEVVDAVRAARPDAVVLVDGGVRQGEDIVRALALGADAVLIGRPFVWALAEGGRAGVAQLGRELVAATRTVMAMCGAAGLADLGPDLVRWSGDGPYTSSHHPSQSRGRS